MGNKSATNVLAGMILGAAAGLIAGVLIAPEKGEDTRKKLKKKANDLAGNIKETYGKYKDDLRDGYEKYKKEFNRKTQESVDNLESEFDELTRK